MDNQANQARLSIPEAVLLGHALVSRVADSRGIRAFFVKGPVTVIQGLRLPRTSGDVDVFVHPGDLEAIVVGLEERGWRKRPVDPDNRTFPKHSVTVDHPEWPCCIDIHFRFPGMEKAPDVCFDVMWANTEYVELAGQQVRVPSKTLGILFLALHSLRSPHLPACQQELDFLCEVMQWTSLGPVLLNLAQATGSLAAMRPFLEPVLPPTVSTVWPDASSEWRNRLMAKHPGSARLIAIRQAPVKEKPGMLFRAVFPVPELHLSHDVYGHMSLSARLKSQGVRWARFLRSAPQVARELNHLRKSDPR